MTSYSHASSSKPHALLAMPARAWQRQHLLGELAARHIATTVTAASLLPWRADPATAAEWLGIQAAVLDRTQEWMRGWADGWADIAADYAQIGRANTVSKLVEQECDLVGQIVALLSDRATAWASLVDNVQIGSSYWLSQKLPRSAD